MKKYIIGALIGFVLSLGVSAHAEVISMIGKVVDGAFPVKVNGRNLQSTAIVIEGTSYIPVREFGDSLGMNIKFDATTGIELTSPAPATAASTQPIGSNPKYVRYLEVVKESARLVNEKLALEDKINVIKTTHATESQNVDDLKQNVAALQAQIDKLVEEKNALEATNFK